MYTVKSGPRTFSSSMTHDQNVQKSIQLLSLLVLLIFDAFIVHLVFPCFCHLPSPAPAPALQWQCSVEDTPCDLVSYTKVLYKRGSG